MTLRHQQHRCESCRDPDCDRPYCVIWKRAFKEGFDYGRKVGYDEGYADGYAAGLAAGSRH